MGGCREGGWGCFGCRGEGDTLRWRTRPSSPRLRRLAGIAVIQGLQEGDDVVDFRTGQGRLVAGMTVEGRLDIDVGVISGRQIVELAYRAVAIARIPFLRV